MDCLHQYERSLLKLGYEGQPCQGFNAFSPVEIMAFIGLIALNSLTLRMIFEHNFKTQQEDPVARNDLCARIFGENKNRRWKEFKLCFYLVDSRVTPP